MTSQERPESIEQKIKVFAFFIFASMGLFGLSLDYAYFIFDDYENIFGNPRIPPQAISDFLFYWKDSSTPIAYNIWQMASLFHESVGPFTYRLLNILVHGCNAFLVYLATYRLYSLLNYSAVRVIKKFALFSALFFLFSPLQVESVVWVSNGRGIYATTFFLLALFLHLNHTASSYKTGQYSVIVCFVISILIKPSTVILPGFLFVIDKVILKRGFLTTVKKLQLYLYPTFGFALVHINDLLSEHLSQLPWWVKVLNACESLQHYFIKGLYPYNLDFNYGISPLNTWVKSESLLNFASPITFTILFLALLAATLKVKRLESLRIPLWCFLLSVLPTVGLLPFDFQNISTVSDRYLYIAIIPISWFVFILIYRALSLLKLSHYLPAVSVFVVASLFVLSFQRAREWSNPEKLILGSLSFREAPDYIKQPVMLSWSQRGRCEKLDELTLDPTMENITETNLFANYLSSCLIKNPSDKILENYKGLGSNFITSPQAIKNFIELSLDAGLYGYFYEMIHHGVYVEAIDQNMARDYIIRARDNSKYLINKYLLLTLEIFYSSGQEARALEFNEYLRQLTTHEEFRVLGQDVDQVIRSYNRK